MHPGLVLVLDYLFIFGARVADVSLSTIRLMMMIRGRRTLAAIISFFEIIIWVLALTRVLQGLDNPLKILVYCLGFATGVYVGQWIEGKMALGINTVQIIPRRPEVAPALRTALRGMGYGVTTLTGEGRDGPREVLLVICPRRRILPVLAVADELAPDAFVTVMDTQVARGGVMAMGRTHG